MVFWLWASSPLDNITVNAANKKTDQSLSDFQTDIGSVTYDILDTKQLIFHTTSALHNTIVSLQGSNREVIPLLQVHESLSKVHDILDNALLKWVGHTAHITV